MRTFVRVCVRVDRLYVHVCVRMRRPMRVGPYVRVSWYIYVCSTMITLLFRFKSDNRELGFQSTYPNSALYGDIP